jgi:hypothetical protein
VCLYALATEVLKLLQQLNAITFSQEVGHMKTRSPLMTASFDSFEICSIFTHLSAPLYLYHCPTKLRAAIKLVESYNSGNKLVLFRPMS